MSNDIKALGSGEPTKRIEGANQAGVDKAPDITAKFNLKRFSTAEQVENYIKSNRPGWYELPFRIALAGYSAPPEGYETYKNTTKEFFSCLVQALGKDKVGPVTSPTPTEKSIDEISTQISQTLGTPIVFLTKEKSLKWLNVDSFSKDLDTNRYLAEEKYVLPTPEIYSQTTAQVSNSLLVIGGREASVQDCINAIKAGNKVVIVLDTKTTALDWNEDKKCPDNASGYLACQLLQFAVDRPLQYPLVKGLEEILTPENREKIKSLVKVVQINDTSATEIQNAANEASAFLKSEEESSVKPEFVLVDNTRVYNKVLGKVQAEEIKPLEANVGTELHLTRHFRALPEPYKASLIGQKYMTYDSKEKVEKEVEITPDKVDSALQVKGSKFNIDVEGFETPRKLIDFVASEAIKKAKAGELLWFDGGFCKKTYFTIELPQIVGEDSVVPAYQANGKEVRGKFLGDDLLVNVANGVKGIPASKISVVIGHIKGEKAPVIFATFPGELTPDFPRDHQGESEKNYNKDFWNNHAFATGVNQEGPAKSTLEARQLLKT